MTLRFHHTPGTDGNIFPKSVVDILSVLQNSCSIPLRVLQNIDTFLPELKPLLQELSGFTGATFDLDPSNPLELKLAGIVEDALLHSYYIHRAIQNDLIHGKLTSKISFWYSFLQLVFDTPVIRNVSYCLSRQAAGGKFPYRLASGLVVVQVDYEPGPPEELEDSQMMSMEYEYKARNPEWHGDWEFINLHILATPQAFFHRSLSLFCLDDEEENFFELMESALHQRRAWGIFQPIAGMKLDDLGISATIIIAWFDKGDSAEMPLSHFFSFPKLFRLDDPADTLFLLRFLISLIPDMQEVHKEALSAWPLIKERGSAGTAWRDDIDRDGKQSKSIREWSAGIDDPNTTFPPVSSASEFEDDPPTNPGMYGYLQDRFVLEVSRVPDEERTKQMYDHYNKMTELSWISNWTQDTYRKLSETVTEAARVLVFPSEDVNGVNIYKTELKKIHLLVSLRDLWDEMRWQISSGEIDVTESDSTPTEGSNEIFDFLGRRLGYVLRASADIKTALWEHESFEAHGECRGAWDRILCHMLRDDADPRLVYPCLDKMLALSRNPLEGVSTKSEYAEQIAGYRDFAEFVCNSPLMNI